MVVEIYFPLPPLYLLIMFILHCCRSQFKPPASHWQPWAGIAATWQSTLWNPSATVRQKWPWSSAYAFGSVGPTLSVSYTQPALYKYTPSQLFETPVLILPRLFHPVQPSSDVPAYREGLLVWPQAVLHGEVPLQGAWEGFHPLPVYRCLPAARPHHFLLLHPHGEAGGTAHCGTRGQQLSGTDQSWFAIVFSCVASISWGLLLCLYSWLQWIQWLKWCMMTHECVGPFSLEISASVGAVDSCYPWCLKATEGSIPQLLQTISLQKRPFHLCVHRHLYQDS